MARTGNKLRVRVNEYYGDHTNNGQVWERCGHKAKEFFKSLGAYGLWKLKQQNKLPALDDIDKADKLVVEVVQ